MFNKPYSEETARIIDEEVRKMIEGQYQRAISILSENKDKLTELAERLLTSEVIFKEDLEQIFGKRTWSNDVVEEINLASVAAENVETTDTPDTPEFPEIPSDEKKDNETQPLA
jgi:cell division protease FtsH